MRRKPVRDARGFSMVELMIVVLLIGMLAAFSLPAIGRWLRLYKVRGAAQQVASEIQTARLKAITRSVNKGVVFIPGYPSATQYQWLIEDTPGNAGVWSPVPAPPGRSGPPNGYIQDLPGGVTFVVAGGGARGVRFNRLGAACWTGSDATDCPALNPDPGGTLFVDHSTGELLVTIDSSGNRKTIRITPGGRAEIK